MECDNVNMMNNIDIVDMDILKDEELFGSIKVLSRCVLRWNTVLMWSVKMKRSIMMDMDIEVL